MPTATPMSYWPERMASAVELQRRRRGGAAVVDVHERDAGEAEPARSTASGLSTSKLPPNANCTSFHCDAGVGQRGPDRRRRPCRWPTVTWAERDASAALSLLDSKLAPGAPLYWIGHSLGGQIIPFVPGHGRLAKAVTVATGSGYWRENALPLRAYQAGGLVRPRAARDGRFGYFPGPGCARSVTCRAA